MMQRILVIEDEAHIAEGIELNLKLQGYDVRIASDGATAIQIWKEWMPDLIVLDIMLPVISGLSVLENIRLEDENVPILILSAKGTLNDRIKGLSKGCDDYLVKPFDLDEFILRIKRLLARASRSDDQPLEAKLGIFKFGNNQINFENSTATCKLGQVLLTEQEIKLLKLFVINKGKPLSRKKLLEVGWGYSEKTMTRTIDNFIVRFRKYFEDNPKQPVYFKSIRSVGYIFDDELV